jgi:hypothetical protein
MHAAMLLLLLLFCAVNCAATAATTAAANVSSACTCACAVTQFALYALLRLEGMFDRLPTAFLETAAVEINARIKSTRQQFATVSEKAEGSLLSAFQTDSRVDDARCTQLTS